MSFFYNQSGFQHTAHSVAPASSSHLSEHTTSLTLSSLPNLHPSKACDNQSEQDQGCMEDAVGSDVSSCCSRMSSRKGTSPQVQASPYWCTLSPLSMTAHCSTYYTVSIGLHTMHHLLCNASIFSKGWDAEEVLFIKHGLIHLCTIAIIIISLFKRALLHCYY